MNLQVILEIAILIFSVIIHEVAHGYAALLLGDSTAKDHGRLTLNPIVHLDPWGSFLFPFLFILSGAGIIFGYAKPVPYNPDNLKDQKFGPALVGAAGPLSNLALALLAGVALRTLLVFGISDGFFVAVLAMIISINVLLMIFNLLPIPPLDGSKLLFAFLPISEYTKNTLEQYGFVILFAFIFLFSGVINKIFYFFLTYFAKIVVGVSLIDLLRF